MNTITAQKQRLPWATIYVAITCTMMLIFQALLTAVHQGLPLAPGGLKHYEPLFPLFPALVLQVLSGEWWNSVSAAVSSVTYIFQHGGLEHFVGNMIFFLLLSPLFESKFGSRLTLFFYFSVGFGAALFHSLFTPVPQIPVVGLSGVICGLIAALLVRETTTALLSVPKLGIALRVYHVAIFVLATQLYSIYLGAGVAGGDRTAYQLHLGGALMGLFLMLAPKFQWKNTEA